MRAFAVRSFGEVPGILIYRLDSRSGRRVSDTREVCGGQSDRLGAVIRL